MTKYTVKRGNESIAAFTEPLEVFHFTRTQIAKAPKGEYVRLLVIMDVDGTCTHFHVGGQGGFPNLSFKLVKLWRDVAKAKGEPYSLADFYRAAGICGECRGWGQRSNSGQYPVPCKDCNMTGKHQDSRTMTLFINERVEGGQNAVLPLETGTARDCIKCYKAMRESGLYDSTAQFYIMENGHIVAIEVHSALLWLVNVPDPKYFIPPVTKPVVVTGFNTPTQRALQEAESVLTSQYE